MNTSVRHYSNIDKLLFGLVFNLKAFSDIIKCLMYTHIV